MGGHVPRRRCVGCGRVAPKSELVRLAVAAAARDSSAAQSSAAQVVIDAAGRLPGRGAYLCRGAADGVPDAGCLGLATRRGGVARALRRRVRLDASRLLAAEPELVESDEPMTATETQKASR